MNPAFKVINSNPLVNKDNKTICHLSFNHSPFDDRIYWKELLSLKKAGYNVVHIAVGENDLDYVTDEGIRIIVIKRKMLLSIPSLNKLLQLAFNKKGTIGELLKKAASLNADVYHYHDLQINAIAAALKNLKIKPKIIYDDHESLQLSQEENLSKGFFKRRLSKFYFDMLLKWEIKNASLCDHLIATDYYTLNYFEKRLPQISKQILFNYSYFIPSEINLQAEKEYHFIYAGYISEGRGIWKMLESIKIVRSAFPQVKLLLIGTFENERLKKEIEQNIIDLALQENVLLKDTVPFKEMNTYYQRSLIGLGLFYDTPKYRNFIPIKLFEYMAFGLPVIFSGIGPSAEIIEEANCGILADINNTEDIAASMKKLLTDKEYFKALSENAKQAIETKYNWKKEEHKLIKLYEDLIN